MTDAPTSLAASSPQAEAFYTESLRQLEESRFPFLLGGTYAVCHYTGLNRATKDMDVFCRASDCPRILAWFQNLGYAIEIEDERWIAKVKKGEHFIDIIYNSTIAVTPVTDHWFAEAVTARVFGTAVRMMPPTELIWSKVFIQDRHKYDGADIAHLMLWQHAAIDWKRLLGYMEQYWEVLLIHVLNFRFVYPSERECIPRWLFDELVGRLRERAELPTPQVKVCRGRLFSRGNYHLDVTEWGFADVVGDGDRKAEDGCNEP